MDKIHDFLMAPTPAQKNEILQLCNKGQSESYFTCYIGAPIQAVSAIAHAAFDVFAEPAKGIKNACFSCIECDSSCFEALSDGFLKGLKSLVQIAVIVSAVVIGLIIPRIVYGSLEGINKPTETPEVPLIPIKSDRYKEKYNELDKTIRAIESELSNIKESKATLETNHNLQAAENKKLTQEIATKNQEIQKAKEKEEKLQLKLQEISGLIATLKSESKKSDDKLTESNNELKQMKLSLMVVNLHLDNIKTLIDVIKEDKLLDPLKAACLALINKDSTSGLSSAASTPQITPQTTPTKYV